MTDVIPDELLNYRITASSYEEELDPGDDPGEFVTRLPFELRQGRLLVAQVHALLIRVTEAERCGVDIAEVFDSVDQDLHELYCAIFDERTGEILDAVADASGLRNVLYIDTVKVIASRRGKKLGLRFVNRIRELNSHGCAVVALRVHPLTAEHPKHPDLVDRDVFTEPFDCEGTAAKDKLRAYWSRLGFKSVAHTDFMAFDTSDKPPAI